MEIEFDPDKAAFNPLIHGGVTFDEAQSVLLDPYALTREDADTQGEVRFVTLGMGGKGRILVVVWMLRGHTLVSVRRSHLSLIVGVGKDSVRYC